MYSETDVLNDALSQIGATFVDGIDDGTVNANHCKRLYPPLRRAILRGHYWNFAMARAMLAQSPDTPPFQYSYRFPLPADWLRMVEYNGANTDTTRIDPTLLPRIPSYILEGHDLLTNDGAVAIVYVRDVTNPALWDAMFYQVVTTWLASKLASAITKDSKMSATLLDMAVKLMLPLAAAVDGQDNPVRGLISDSLTWGR